MREIITSMVRFETSVADLPANAKQAKELTPDAIEKKVLATCDIWQKIQKLCTALKSIDFSIVVT